ncbi:fimbrial protein [Burkholderia stagnalis]|uniref:fimbrial protein n=2 Tax=Burkholderia stagnalis TaxID=1503054 RepID=UPI000A5511A6|nr:fimbrial protein [Burkholderia stagnalis]
MKRFIYAGLLAVMLVMPGWAWAQCWVKYPDGTVWNTWNPAEVKKPVLFVAPAFEVSFNPNVPVGTYIFSKRIDFDNVRGGKLYCTGGFGRIYYLAGKEPSTQRTYFFPTGIPGVNMGISISGSPWAEVSYWGPSPAEEWDPPDLWRQLYIFLIKTGPITEGGVFSGRVGSMWPKDLGVGALVEWHLGNMVINPQVPTCRVTTPAITVPLGSMRASTFTGVGTPSPSKPFNIELECSGIETGKNLNVYTTLTDHTNPGNVSDTLTLAKDSTATGIGIQVLNGSTVVKYGPDSSAIGNKNQWKAGAAGNGTFTIPLTARYVQTAPKITPGTANGLATFTMSYQ